MQLLLNKPSLQACSLQQVDYLAHQYPYFSTAQLLLLQKADKASEMHARQLQRTALHFTNPLQLSYWLQPALFETEFPEPELFQNPIPEAAETVEVKPAEQPETSSEENREKAVAGTALPAPEVEAAQQPIAVTAEATIETPEAPAPENAAQPEAPVISFEPYHTVDYFASQGIKLSQQEAANDTLGKQVKSFTEWLKTMKRLPETATPQPANAVRERNVENLAAHSLDTSEVVTESMAEVWLKQGNGAKAAEVYRKLSLRNPAKSAYFAAKIESLKQH